MRKLKLSAVLLFITSLFFYQPSNAQDHNIIGTWKFEKFPDSVKLDEVGMKMRDKFFADMTLSFDSTNYSRRYMGRTENGSYNLLEENTYEFISVKGIKSNIELIPLGPSEIIHKKDNLIFHMRKIDDQADVETEERNIDKVEGVLITAESLQGSWAHAGQIKNGKEIPLIIKHKKNKAVTYSFKRNHKFINRSLLGLKLKGNWFIDKDQKTLIIKSGEKTEYFKITKLDSKELHLYNPQVETIIKFVKS